MTAIVGQRDQRGQVGGIEAVVFGMLVLVVGVLVIANAWGVIDAKMAAAAAAREAARTYAKAPPGSDPMALAAKAGHETLQSLGRNEPANGVALVAGSFTRCAAVTFRVAVRVPLISLPWIGRHGTGFTAIARHSEIVDPYRSGVRGDPAHQGAAACA